MTASRSRPRSGAIAFIEDALVLLACMLALAGCASMPPPSDSPAPPSDRESIPPSTSPASPSTVSDWVEPADYVFSVESACGERAQIGAFQVTVRDHRTVAFRGLDDAGRRYRGDPGSVPTLAMILSEAEDARANNASSVEVTSDPVDGHPVNVAIDLIANGIDDESCYRVSEYLLAADPSPSG